MKKIYLGSQLISSLDGNDIAYKMSDDGAMVKSVASAINDVNSELVAVHYRLSGINSDTIGYELSANGSILKSVKEKIDELDDKIESIENDSSGSGTSVSVTDDGNGHVTILATGDSVSITSDGNGNVNLIL